MGASASKSKPTLEAPVKESQLIAGKSLIKRKVDKHKELALLQEILEFEERYQKPRDV
jgi:hypothetical protein